MTDVPIPAHRALSVKLGPPANGAPTVVYDVTDADALPQRLQEQFCNNLEHVAVKKREIRGVLIDERFRGQRRLAVLKFARGVKPYEALKLARKLLLWSFEDLGASASRMQAGLRRDRSRAIRGQKKSARRAQRQEFGYRLRRPLLLTH